MMPPRPELLLAATTEGLAPYFLGALMLVAFGFGMGLLLRVLVPRRVKAMYRFLISSGTRFALTIVGAVLFSLWVRFEWGGPDSTDGIGLRVFLLTLAAAYVVTMLVEMILIVPAVIFDHQEKPTE